MSAILGIDAAWGPRAPSGVALVAGSARRGWRVVALAPSVDAFCGLAEGRAVDWRGGPIPGGPFRGGPIEAARLIAAARALGAGEVVCAGVDMPLAHSRITGRRPCDNAIGAAYVGVHSPLPDRPGAFGRALQAGFERAGFRLATADGTRRERRALLEVYPHAALMALLGLRRRFPYKVSRSTRYWPGAPADERARRLLAQFRAIRAALTRELGPVPLPLPRAAPGRPLAALKRYEDALDALVCAWVGTLYLRGRARAFGDGDAAIWAPERD